MPEPWEQLPEELPQAFVAFTAYRKLGIGRTIDGAWRAVRNIPDKTSRAPRYFRNWASRYDWRERARKWDARADLVEQEAREEVIRRTAAADEERRQKQRQREAELLEKGWEKLNQMLAFGLARRKSVSDDGKTTIFEPVKWNFNTAAQWADLLIKLGRLNAKMPAVVEPEQAPELFQPDERYL